MVPNAQRSELYNPLSVVILKGNAHALWVGKSMTSAIAEKRMVFPEKLEIEVAHDSTILLLGVTERAVKPVC